MMVLFIKIIIIKIHTICCLYGFSITPIIYEKNQFPISYSIIDSYSISVKYKKNESIKNLTLRITKKSSNDFEKARSIYRWITKNITYDVDSYFNQNISHELVDPSNVLKTKQSVCSGYANLFYEMARSVGIKSEVVTGFAKGYGFQPGDTIDDSNHAWNAVKLNNNWYLIDCTWGAGNIGKNKKFNRSYVDFYFLTNPEYLIYSHFPDNARWQLLSTKFSKSQFSELPYVKPKFFTNHIKFIGNHKIKYEIKNDLKIGFKINPKIKIMSKLTSKDDLEIEGAVFMEPQGDKKNFFVRPPESGEYIFSIFVEDNANIGKYNTCVSYLIKTDENYLNNNGYVKLWYDFLERYDIKFNTPHQFKYSIKEDLVLHYDINPKTELLFSLKKETTNENIDGALYVERSGRSTRLSVRPSEAGVFRLNMFAKKIKNKEKFDGCAEYQIIVPNNYKKNNGFVKLWDENIEKYQVRFKDIHDYSHTIKDRIDLEYLSPDNLLYTANLTDKSGTKFSRNVFFQKTQSGTSLFLSSPDNDEYKLIVFAKFKSQKTKYKSIAEYKIYGSNKSDPFPLQYSSYGEFDARLIEPMVGNLYKNKSYDFILEINETPEISLIQNGKWTNFSKDKNIYSIKNLNIGSGDIQIAAKNKGSSRFTTILEYNVF
tara:strand:+ start:1739 stop:3703 length:1965 start_codon:yes stop_codon:yes gene_type:complete